MGKNTLILMRHAKSGWPDDGRRDFDRPLAPRGGKDAPRMGKWLRKHGLVPDMIVSSPALRARATAELVAGRLHIPARRIMFDERIYEASLRQLRDVITTHGADSNTLLLVGHNPGLEELLVHLAATPPPRDERGKLMTTASIAVLDFKGALRAAGGAATLRLLVRPRELKASSAAGPD